MKNKIKRLFSSKKNIAIAISALLIFAMATSATFAWFKNIFSVQGVEMNTGMFEYQFLGYSSADMTPDFKYSTNSQDSGFKYIGDVEGVTATRDVTNMQQISSEEPGVLYYVVRKTEGSIDLDVALKFDADFSKLVRFSEVLTGDESGSTNLSTESATESLGSFWYSISSVKGGGTQFSDLSSIENYIKADSTKFTSLIPTADGKNRYFPDIRKEIINESLGKDDTFVCFRIEYGISGATPANTGITMPLGVTLHVAQKGGIGEYTGKTHIVTTLDELNTALSTYRPHDTVVIAGDIEYKGNLNIDNILNIVIENGSLTVKGNMRYTYAGVPDDVGADTEDNYKPAQAKFEIRVKSGYLKILQMDAADLGEGVTDVGGNLYFDIPNSTMTISGRNDTGAGNADIYIQNDFHVNTDYADKGESPVGLILSNVSIRDLDDSAVNMYLHEDTQLTVGQDVSLGTVKAIHSFYDPTSSLRLHVQNYGIINHINFEDMSFINIADPMPYTPRILIDNYGVIKNPIRVASFSRPFDPEKEWDMSDPNDRVTATQYNTRVIWEQGAGKMSIDNYNQSNFRTEHIERILKTTLIDKVNGDDTNIVIHYMDNDNVSNTTIASLLEYYQIGAGAEGDLKIAATKDIKSLKIICYTGYYLTEADYNTIRQMESVETIDLSEAVSALDESKTGGVLPDGAFMGLTQLKNLTLSSKDVKWGANLFQGTQIDEIELPSRLATLHRDALNGIIYLHMGNKAGLVYETEFMSRVMARNAYIFGTDAARNELISLIEGADETTVGTYKERTDPGFEPWYNALKVPSETQLNKIANIRLEAQRYGDYFLTLYDDSCRVVAYIPKDGKIFNAANEQNNQSIKHADGNVYRFTFSEFDIVTYDADGNIVSDNKYDIVEYDDFVFYKTNVSGIGDTLIFNERLTKIGDVTFYKANLPKNVNLGGCKTIGHVSLATNSSMKNIAGLYVETAGYYACAGQSLSFVNMPRLSYIYGFTFGLPERIDVSLVQMAADALPKAPNYSTLVISSNSNIAHTAVVIHTENVTSTPSSIVRLGYQAAFSVFAPDNEDYATLLKNANYTSNVVSLGSHDASTIGVMTFGGVDVTDDLFNRGDYLFKLNEDNSTYALLKCICPATIVIDGSIYSDEYGVFTIPAYTDESGRKTTSAAGSVFSYHTLYNVVTLTFADDYKTIGASFFGGGSYASKKYVAHIDLNNIELIGNNAFYNSSTLLSVKGDCLTSVGKSAFQDCKKLLTVSLPNLKGMCEQSFYNCISLKMALVGPITGSNVFGVNSGAGIDPIKDLILFINAKNAPSDTGVVYLTGNGGNVYFQVISLGGEFFWDRSGNSPYYNTDSNPDNDVAYPYSQLVVEADVSSLMFADWVDGDSISVQLANSTDSKYTYTYTVSTPTYMFSEDQDGLTIQLSFGLGNIVADTYVIPDTLYVKNEPVDSIVGSNNIKYFTTNVEGSGSTGKKVVAIEDNIYSGGKITANTVQFPTGLKTIGKNAFSGCTIRNGINITGAEGGLIIEDRAFYDVTAGSLTISNVTEIGNEAFYGIKNKDEFGASAAMSSIQLGSKLSSIGESAFEGANAASVTTTHDNANPIILTIGENAFKNLKNGTGGEVAVNFSGAVADFGANSFYNVKMSNLTAPNTILVRANAFYMVDITGIADFSQGVPAEMVAAHGYQIVEPYGFRGTSSDKNQLGTVKLGENCLLMGDYDSSNGTYPVVEGSQVYRGAFTYCDIQALRFNENIAQEPQAIAFSGCSFKEIRLGALTTLGINYGGVGSTNNSTGDVRYQFEQKATGKIVDNKAYTNFMFVNCTTLGDVYFTNITDFKFTFRGGSNHEITLHELVITELKSGAFASLKLVGDEIVFPDGMAVNSTAFANTVVNADLIFGDNTTIKGSESFRDSTFNGDIYFGNGLTITASYPFNRSKINGTVSIGSVSYTHNSSNNGMFGAAAGNKPNAYTGYVKNLVFRDTCTSVPDRLLAYCNFDVVDLTHIEALGNGAFAHSVVGEIIGMDGVKTIGNNAFGVLSTATHVLKTTVTSGLDISNAESIGEGAFVNLTFKDAVSLSKILEIKANAFKNCTFEQPLTVGSALGTNILDSAFEGAKFNSSIDLAGVKTVGASAFKGATFSETLQLKDITSFGANAFTNAIVNGDLIFGTRAEDGAGGYTYTGPASAIGESAFGSLTTYDTDGTTVLSYLPGVTVTGEVNFVNVKGIDTNGFRGAVLSATLTFGADIYINDSAFYGVTVPAVTFVGSPTIQPNAFKQSKITILTFRDAGEIHAEAFAEGVYGTIKLGAVTLIGGIEKSNIVDHPTKSNAHILAEGVQETGAFRAAVIGNIYFENAAQPMYYAFCDTVFNGLVDFGNITKLAYDTGATDVSHIHTPFVRVKRIEHMNLSKVAEIGQGYFAKMTIGTLDPVTTALKLIWHSFSSVTFESDVVFEEVVTIDNFGLHDTCVFNGNLTFEKGVYAESDVGQQSWVVKKDLYIQKFLNEHGQYIGAIGNRSFLSGAVIEGTFTLAEGPMNATFYNTTFGNVNLSGITQIPGKNSSTNAQFNKCTFNSSVISMSSLTALGDNAFENCTFEDGVVFALPSLSKIGSNAFLNCSSLTSINFPAVTEFTGTSPFVGCTGLKTVIIGNSFETLGDNVFKDIQLAPDALIYLNGVTSIGDNAFAGCTTVSMVSMPKVQTVGSNAFLNCTSIRAIELPELTSFTGTSPFVGCTALKTVVIGDKFTNWGTGAFDASNTELDSVILKTPIMVNIQGNVPSVTNIVGTIALPANAKFLVPDALKAAYKSYFDAKRYNEAGPIWGSITPDNFGTVELILRDANTGVNYLATLLYGTNIEIVGIIDTGSAMNNATFTFPSELEGYTVVSVSGSAMREVTSTVTTVGLPSAMMYINFSGLDLHSNVQAYSIENNSLYQAIDGVLYTADGKTLVMYPTGKAGDFVVPATVMHVGAYAFAGNQNVSTITFMGNVTISDGAFANCYGLNKIAFQAVMVDGTASAPVVRFTGRNTVSGCMLTGDDSLKIQVCGTAYPEVLYDTQLYSLFELTAVPAAPTPDPAQNNDAGVQNAGGENVENGSTVESGATEPTETPAV